MRAVSHDRDAWLSAEAVVRRVSRDDLSGAGRDPVSLIGKTVSWVRDYLGEAFTIPSEAIALVDGKRVPEDFVLERGQIIEFTDEDEEEDWARELHRSPEFWEMIRQRRREVGIPWDEAKRLLGDD
jgi:hypothetical protein